MKRILGAAALASALALGACSGTTSTTTAVIATDVIKAVQTTCGFIPTAASIASLFTADPALATATQAADLICAAFEQQKTSNGRLSTAIHALKGGETLSFVMDVNGNPITISGTTK
jgi:hypothetical protein